MLPKAGAFKLPIKRKISNEERMQHHSLIFDVDRVCIRSRDIAKNKLDSKLSLQFLKFEKIETHFIS